MIECVFSDPLYSKKVGEITTLIPPDATNVNFVYSKMSCSDTSTSSTSTLPEYITHITSTSTPERSFYISNTIDLGQVLMLGFFILIFVFAIMISVKHLIFKKF
jgi:predicted S18 family serine protease